MSSQSREGGPEQTLQRPGRHEGRRPPAPVASGGESSPGLLRSLGRRYLPERARALLRSHYYRGSRYGCNYCGGRWRALMPRGQPEPVLAELGVAASGRRAADCPRCRASDRDRHLLAFLELQTSIFRQAHRVLHIAPELPLARRLRATATLDYVAGDSFAGSYRYPSFVSVMDVTELPFAAGEFDAVICNHVLEHVSDDTRALGEIRRVLRDDGWAILQVPLASGLARTREDRATMLPGRRRTAYGQADHVRLYGRDYPDRLARAGFEVGVVRLAEEGHAHELERLGVDPSECIYRARKRPQSQH